MKIGIGAIWRFLLGAVVIVSCSFIAPASGAGEEIVLNRGNGGEPTTLDPHRTDGRVESNILRDLFEGLVAYGPDGRILPGVAERWEVSADGRVYTFHLRADARWSNGEALTAEDFVYGMRRAMAPGGGILPSPNLGVIMNGGEIATGKLPADQIAVSATDAQTLVIRLEAPTPYFLALLASDNSALPVYRPAVEAAAATADGRWDHPGTLIGNGAYRLEAWTASGLVTLVRNPHFHDAGNVEIDRVVFHPISDASTEIKMFIEGRLDITNEVPQERVKWISLTHPSEFWNKPFLATYYYAFNLSMEPFKGNLNLRKALSMAIHRQAIVKKVTRAGEMPAYGMVPPIVPHYRRQLVGFSALTNSERLDEARHLFNAAGYSPTQPLQVEILYNTSTNNRLIAESVITMWTEAFGKSISVTAVGVERKEYLARRARGEFQIVRAAWIGDYADPTVFLNLFRSTEVSPRNDPGFRDLEYDKLLEKASIDDNSSSRYELLGKAEKMLIESHVIAPIYHYSTKSLVNPRLEGWVFNIRDVHPTRFLSFGPGPGGDPDP